MLVDGDATYDAASAPRMIETLLADHLDMVVGLRIDQAEAAYRRGHRTGNWMLTGFLSSVFGQEFKDILSGYRVFSRRFVKSFPVLSDGFEIETELSVHALELALPVAEIETPYYARPEGSFSKLNTWRDGFRILGTIIKLYRSEKPLRFFTAIGSFLALVSVGLAIPVIVDLSRIGHRSAAADRGAVDGLDDPGRAVGLFRAGARYGDAGPARDEAAGLSVPARDEQATDAACSSAQPRRWTARPSDAIPRPDMSDLSLTILAETAGDAQAIERLHERTFGPGRFVLSAYRLREHVDHLLDLSFTARIGTLLVARSGNCRLRSATRRR